MPEITTPDKKVKDDEIDLLDLFSRIAATLTRWANNVVRAFLISVVFMIRRWLPLGLSLAAGISLSYIFKSASPSFYTSDMVLRNNLVQMDKIKLRDVSGTTAELISKINKLNTLNSENNLLALSNALSMRPESV